MARGHILAAALSYPEFQHCTAWVAARLFFLQPLAGWPQHGSFGVYFSPMLWDATLVYPHSAVLLSCPGDTVVLCSVLPCTLHPRLCSQITDSCTSPSPLCSQIINY